MHDPAGRAAACRAADTAARHAPPAGYAMMLPAGWRRIPVQHGTGPAIDGLVDEVFSRLPGLPRDRGLPARLELRRRLAGLASQGRGHAALDVYLPAGPVHGVAVTASIVVSRGAPGALAGWDEFTARLAGGAPGVRPVQVDGAAGVRLQRVSGPGPARGTSGWLHVDYVLPVPGVPGDWLVAAFSALAAGGPGEAFAGVLAEMFDAIMSTFRWVRS